MAVQPQRGKPSLVLLHGWGLNHAVWQHLIPLLADDYQLLTPDLPGFGLNQQCPSPYTLSAVAAEMAATIPPQSLVLGWSLGGLIATQLALEHPEKVKALALVASSPCFLAKAGWPGMDERVLSQFAGALSKDLALTVERFLAIQALGSETARQDIKALKQAVLSLPLPSSEALAGGLQLLADGDLRSRLAELQMPLTYCFGRLDSLVPVAMLDTLSQICPAAEVTLLSKASHAPFISHQTEFMQWLRQWAAQASSGCS